MIDSEDFWLQPRRFIHLGKRSKEKRKEKKTNSWEIGLAEKKATFVLCSLARSSSILFLILICQCR